MTTDMTTILLRRISLLLFGLLAVIAADAQSWRQQAPLIGISCDRSNSGSNASKTYVEAVREAGGVPVLIPFTTDSVSLRQTVASLDGVLMTGGKDVAPKHYGEPTLPVCGTIDSLRDVFDLLLIKTARQWNVPLLGICRGSQAINVALGGSLIQDIPSHLNDTTIRHRQKQPSAIATHTIHLVDGSMLAKALGAISVRINSHHHQSVKQIAPGLRVTARADDGIVEAFESCWGEPVWGIQGHPEGLLLGGDKTWLPVFKFFVDRAKVYSHARQLHCDNIVVDTHTDTPLSLLRGSTFASRNTQVCLPKMEEGGIGAQYLACFCNQKNLDDAGRAAARQKVESLLDAVDCELTANADRCALARSAADVKRIRQEGKTAVLIGVENGYAIGLDIDYLDRLKQRAVSYVTLCWSRNNDICGSSSDPANSRLGLTKFGRKVVKRMDKLGMMIDLSHASERTFYDVARLSKRPLFCSHSASNYNYIHNRNLTDDQLRTIARSGGVAQATAVDDFMAPKEHRDSLTVTDFVDNICHMVRVAGIDHVGIGSDFDGGGGVHGYNGANDMVNITAQLIDRGFSDSDIAKLLGANFLRVMQSMR